jgi:hypothetical protein
MFFMECNVFPEYQVLLFDGIFHYFLLAALFMMPHSTSFYVAPKNLKLQGN